ncbi:uncharacterized protein LOC144724201 [Lampetra planeri]
MDKQTRSPEEEDTSAHTEGSRAKALLSREPLVRRLCLPTPGQVVMWALLCAIGVIVHSLGARVARLESRAAEGGVEAVGCDSTPREPHKALSQLPRVRNSREAAAPICSCPPGEPPPLPSDPPSTPSKLLPPLPPSAVSE